MNQMTFQLASQVSKKPQDIAALYLRWVLGIDPTDSTLRTPVPTIINELIKWVKSPKSAVLAALPSFNPFIDEIKIGDGIGLRTALDRYRNNVLDDDNTPKHIIDTLPGIWEDMQLAVGVIGF
ncbi:hypothetical protein AYI84_18855 [Shewanella algae]|uniref:hypothetical protein n=1 Tax=Shewanella algae TaxID=38313 RepID=UPI001182521C|nr:hypothetical protein [Shewanella algae]TVK99344.1 hypothetical protein AYI84_18855 [Shewanella algae]TVL47871.1 hypothetical protein AYI99_10725 [Shewanella algae]